VENELGWTLTRNFEEGIKDTVDWYLSNQEWIDDVLTGEYKNSYITSV